MSAPLLSLARWIDPLARGVLASAGLRLSTPTLAQPPQPGTPATSWGESRALGVLAADHRAPGPLRKVIRLARASRGLLYLGAVRRLLDNPLFRRHVALVDTRDVLFFLTWRAYLARGLGVQQRIEAAAYHYDRELASFADAYHAAVYTGTGLELWRAEAAGHTYALRLVPGSDVLHEGGLSIVLFADGGRVAVLTFTYLDGTSVGLPPSPTIFVGRKQLAAAHDWQDAFNRAFDRTSPAHMCLAALQGIAAAQGFDRFAAVAHAAHPNFTDDKAEVFENAYSRSWAALGGAQRSACAWVVPLPLQLTPIDRLDRRRRRRALARRAHLERITKSAATMLAGLHRAALPAAGADRLAADHPRVT